MDGKSSESESTESTANAGTECAGRSLKREVRARALRLQARALRAVRAQARVDGKRTESENIADHGGLKVALQALKVLVVQKYNTCTIPTLLVAHKYKY